MTLRALRGSRTGISRGLAAVLPLAVVLALAGPARAGENLEGLRHTMVQQQVKQRGITKPDVLAAMEQVPRHLFVPDSLRADAYSDRPLVLGPGRSIFQPYLVALMTQLLELKKGDKVLEIGTGSGYHAAVLSRIAREVYSVEIVDNVAYQAGKRLSVLGYHNVEIRVGDGRLGWPEKAPFDAILLSVGTPEVPPKLIQQLRVGGKMVLPLGGIFFQDLLVITKAKDGIEKRTIIPVRLSQAQDGGK